MEHAYTYIYAERERESPDRKMKDSWLRRDGYGSFRN